VWDWLTKVQGKLPFRHFREGGNPEIQSVKHGPPLCSEGDDGEWARVTKVRASTPVRPSFSRRRKSRNTVSQEWTSVLKKCYEHYGLV
jgi:hypothetical protein